MSGADNAPAAADTSSRPQHDSSFKLRFSRCREPGRSDVSLVKPLGLPATVTDKFYRVSRPQAAEEARVAAALQRIEDMFALGPRERYPRPLTAAHEYGWHSGEARTAEPRDRRLQHHIRDSAWLKARVRVLHADSLLKHR